eukprot:TRINITY_DN4568_c0_g1_i3.p2 TRINITY_DN4568_c0_g1~~TRINITY_DN4568_c0_g1_i3.p2  ORF type:complete len:216 (+),score=56.16 TRINITY_DN4568_c0_g1_i3:4-651(+)
MQNSSSSSSMTGFKKVLWVRHAQGEHNVVAEHSGLDACRNPALWDARLTAHGHQQAAAAAAVHQAVLAKAEVVVVSPLSRCIETATAMMERACPGRRVAYVALEDVRESHGWYWSEKRRSVGELKARFPSVDFSLIETEHDELWSETERETMAAITERAERALAFLRSRPEEHIVVVTHYGFLWTVWSLLHTAGTVDARRDPVRSGGAVERWSVQ